MKIIKKIITWTYSIVLVIVLVFFAGMHFFPEQITKVAGYQFVEVASNTMEPTIPSNSLVLTKLVDEDTNIKSDTIITFRAERMGSDIYITHYFVGTQLDYDGEVIYRTQGEGAKHLDSYETMRKDIVGTYVGHVPYVGKIYRFLLSTWGVMTLGLLFAVLIINRFINVRLEKSKEKDNEAVFHKPKKTKEKPKPEKEPEVLAPAEEIKIICDDMIVQDQYMVLQGKVTNHTKHTIYFLRVKIKLQNETGKTIHTNLWYMVGREGLLPGTEVDWKNTIIRNDEIERCQFEIISCKKTLRKKG